MELKDVILARKLGGGGSGGGAITDGIVITEMGTFGTGIGARISATKVDYYGTYMPFYTFGAGRGDNSFGWQDLTEINFKSNEVYLSWGNFMYCKSIKEISTPVIKGRDPRFIWNFNANQQETSIFRNMTSLETLSLPEFVGFLNHYDIASCIKLKNVYLPKVTKACSYGDTGIRGSFSGDTALENVQLGSVGYAVDALEANTFIDCTSAFALTMYTKGTYADTLLAKARNSATNATIIIKASEDTTYNGTSYAAGDTMITSTVEATT